MPPERPGLNTDADAAALVAALQQLDRAGLSPGASGNASLRVTGGMLISASGYRARDITTQRLVFVSDDGAFQSAESPSSEYLMHLQVYRDHPDIAAIIHCHSRYATALACQRRGIPPFHYMVAVAGGRDIPCVDYATFGSPELAALVSAGLGERRACLLANHGQIATGDTPASALLLAEEIEELAANWLISSHHGEAVLLSEAEIDAALARFKTYRKHQI